jgi:hypothetical protein
MNYLKSVYKISLVFLLCSTACSTSTNTVENKIPKEPLTYAKEIHFLKDHYFYVNDFLPCEEEGFFIVGIYDSLKYNKSTTTMLESDDKSTNTACIMKLARDSSIIWTKKFPHPEYASQFRAIIRGDGNKLYLLKNNYINTFSGKGYEIIQIDGEGKEYSRWSYGETLSAQAEEISKLPDGDFIVAGNREKNLTKEVGFKIKNSGGYPTITLAPTKSFITYERIGPDGKLKWKKEIHEFIFCDFETGTGNNFYIRGYDNSKKIEMLMAFDKTNGSHIWSKTLAESFELDHPSLVLPDSTIAVFYRPKDNKGVKYKRYTPNGTKINDTLLGIPTNSGVTSVCLGLEGIFFSGIRSNRIYNSIFLGALNLNGSIRWIENFEVNENCSPYCYAMLDKRIAMRITLWDKVENKTYLKIIVTNEFGKIENLADSTAAIK